MKKIIPFKKNIIFKTNLAEIVSISLEHEIKKEDMEVKGNFIISGSYKISESSVNAEEFYYDLPFAIQIDEKYDLENVTMDIDDFYYEIINNNILSVNIDVALDNVLEKEIIKEETPVEEKEEEKKKPEEEVRCIDEEELRPKPVKQELPLDDMSDIADFDMTKETYQSYRVLIIREGDTIESVMKKYQVTKEELEAYNDLNEWNIMDKIIIPVTNVEN